MCFRLLLLAMLSSFFFFFNDTATTEIYTLSLHDALPICEHACLYGQVFRHGHSYGSDDQCRAGTGRCRLRSEEHTSELQSHLNLVCRLLLEKKKTHPVPTSTLPTQ